MKLNEIRPVVREITPRKYTPERRRAAQAQHCELVFIQEGRGDIRMDGRRTASVMPGCVAVIPARSSYLIRPPEESIQALAVSFDYLEVEADGESPPRFEDALCLNSPLILKSLPELEKYLINMLKIFMRKEPYWQLQLSGEMAAILACVVQQTDGASHTLITRVIDIVTERYMEPLNNTLIASELGYHPNYVNSVFVKEMGVPLHQYLMRYRIETAAHLLLNTSLSVSDIAEQVGFRHFSHFSSCFHRLIGITPAAYRLER